MTAAILVLGAVTILFKGAGSLVRTLPPPLERQLGGLAPALLAALIVTETVDDRGIPALDARLAGVAFAAFLAWRRAPFWLCVIAGAAVAAVLRMVGVG